LTDWQDAVEISKIFFLTEDGIIKYEWHPNEDEPMGLGGLVVHRGRLFVVYTGKFHGNSVSNEVLIRELQCAP